MESHILPCPVCGVGINASLSVCPVCKSETHFVDNPSADIVHKCAACGEVIPEKAAFCPMCGEPTGVKAPAAPRQAAPAAPQQAASVPPVAPPLPSQTQQMEANMQQPYATAQPTEQQQAKKSKLTPVIVGLLAALAVAVIVLLVMTLLNKGGNEEAQPESVSTNIAMEHRLDSIKSTLPVAAEEIVRYVDDEPALFYLYDNHMHRIDGETLEDETIDFQKANREARIDYRAGGIIEARPTKDDRYLFVHAYEDGETQGEALYRYDVKTGKVYVLGFGHKITDQGSGYLIQGPNSEKRVDAYGNIVGDRDPGVTEEEPKEEKPASDQQRSNKPVKPRVEERPQTEVITVQPEPAKPVETPVENKGTGFHLEEI